MLGPNTCEKHETFLWSSTWSEKQEPDFQRHSSDEVTQEFTLWTTQKTEINVKKSTEVMFL